MIQSKSQVKTVISCGFVVKSNGTSDKMTSTSRSEPVLFLRKSDEK
jgi:hypothetical protein